MRQSQRYVREPVNWTQLQPNWESSSSSMECQIERSVYQRTERRNASETLLPDRPISPHLNQVTEAGLKALEAPASRGAWSHSADEADLTDGVETVQDGRIYIERENAPFLAAGGSGDDFRTGIERAIALGWLWLHESGTYVKFTDSGVALFA